MRHARSQPRTRVLWCPVAALNSARFSAHMTTMPTALLGFTAHAAAVYAKLFLDIPDRISSPQATQYLGILTWFTVQTNIICCLRFAAVLVATFAASTDLTALTVRLFPLSFSLGSVLTVLYYSLDYYQEENIKMRKQCSKTIAPLCELAAHISHGPALPLALLDALTLAASGYTQPGAVDVVGGYVVFYMTQTLINHAATGVWQYAIVADAQRAAGWPGVLLFFAAIAAITISAGRLGVAIAGFPE